MTRILDAADFGKTRGRIRDNVKPCPPGSRLSKPELDRDRLDDKWELAQCQFFEGDFLAGIVNVDTHHIAGFVTSWVKSWVTQPAYVSVRRSRFRGHEYPPARFAESHMPRGLSFLS